MIQTADIAAICAAIDAGNDSALPILADALEEVGDPRAARLRQASFYLPPYEVGGEWAFGCPANTQPKGGRDALPYHLHSRLGEGSPTWFPTRSAAYLALAAALQESARG